MKFRESGFTIVEVMLVLAITGLVLAMTLAGINSSLNQQRYADAQKQAIDFFRGQYDHVSNTLNDRPATSGCDSSGLSTTATSERGASDCFIVGSVIRNTDGKTMTVHQVLATNDVTNVVGVDSKNDVQILRASGLIESTQTDSYTMEWQTRLLRANSQNKAIFSILVVRVPVSGTIKTYIGGPNYTLAQLVSSMQAELKVCVDTSGYAFIEPTGIDITNSTVNASGVQFVASGDCK